MIRLVYDCLRSPYDLANILQVDLATGACELYITGNSLHHDHHKVSGKVGSWSAGIRKHGYPESLSIHYYTSLDECANELHQQGVQLIGTSPAATSSFNDLDFTKEDVAIVFGTEVGGLSKEKMRLLDGNVKIPMQDDIDFMTLSVVTPIVVYEALRQQNPNSHTS